jgi:hypothetical protein
MFIHRDKWLGTLKALVDFESGQASNSARGPWRATQVAGPVAEAECFSDDEQISQDLTNLGCTMCALQSFFRCLATVCTGTVSSSLCAGISVV